MMVRNYLKGDPNDPKILKLMTDVVYGNHIEHIDNEYLNDTMDLMPDNARYLLFSDQNFCFMNKGAYLFVGEDKNLFMTPKNAEKINAALWNFSTYYEKFMIYNYSMKNEFICISTNEGEKLKVGQSYTYPAWQLFFSDSYTRVKVGNGEQYFKIEDNRVVLADSGTIWDLVRC